MLAKELLRHQSVATTQEYLHADRSDPEQALASMQVARSDLRDSA
jgi:hypothetical protein